MNTRSFIYTILAYKVIFYLFCLLIVSLIPAFDTVKFHAAYHWPEVGEPTIVSSFTTWDAAHYLYISKYGYRTGESLYAFYPLLPWTIRGLARITGSHFVAGLILTNVFFVGGMLAFFQWMELHYGKRNAIWSVLIMLSFPGALFYNFVYTESLWLFLVARVLIAIQKRRSLEICICAFFLPLTRPVGVLLIAVIFSVLAERQLFRSRRSEPARVARLDVPCDQRICLILLSSLSCGFACYLLHSYLLSHDALIGFKAQRFFPASPSIVHLFQPMRLLRAAVDVTTDHTQLTSYLDRYYFLVWALLLPAVRRNGIIGFYYYLFICGLPAFTNLFMSYVRFVGICFPLFIVLGTSFSDVKARTGLFIFLGCNFAVQAALVARHLMFLWAG